MRGLKNQYIRSIVSSLCYKKCCIQDKIRKKNVKSHILMFHDIISEGNYSVDPFCVDYRRLNEIIEWHIERHYEFVSINQYKVFKKEKQCIITFDDGLSSVLNAIPLFEKYNIPFCVYIVTDKIGELNYLSENEIRELSKNILCTIGSHTHTHRFTRLLSEDELIKELTISKSVLERITSKPIEHFAYPYGSFFACSLFDDYYVKNAGFKTSVVTKQVPLIFHGNYRMPRFDAAREDLLEVL